MPLALGASLVLVLSSLSLQTTTLQTRSRLASTQRLRHAEDALLSVAQILVADLNERHACLFPLPLAKWSTMGRGCLEADDEAPLHSGRVLDIAWQVLDWQPLSGPGGQPRSVRLTLRIDRDGEAIRREGVVAISLGGDPPRANDIQLVHLLGAGT